MNSIADTIKSILTEPPKGVRLIAVSKFHPVIAIADAYVSGQRLFGSS